MNEIFVICLMLFMHIIDDYVLQAPCLCDLKQKSFWEKNAPQPLYRYDYIVALLMHAFSWSFMVMLPIAIALGFNIDTNFIIMLGANTLFHALIDDLIAEINRLNNLVSSKDTEVQNLKAQVIALQNNLRAEFGNWFDQKMIEFEDKFVKKTNN